MNPKKTNQIAKNIIYGSVGLLILLLLFLIGYILVTGLPGMSWHFLTSVSQSFAAGGGIRDQIFNSVYILILTTLISFPIALGVGIYLAEYAKDSWFTNLLRTIIELLSSLPSIVVGLFGYLLFVIKFQIGFSIISGAITLTFFNLPLLTRSIEDAFRAVPLEQRQAGVALGISKWKTIMGIVFPCALPKILTGVILSAGRIFGEAAALIFTAGQSDSVVNYANWNPFSSTSPLNVFRPAETLAVHIWKVNTESILPDAHQVSSGSAAVLIIVILGFNLGARWLGNVVYRKLTATDKER
ncbi:phosphate ABC transporter permease PstA [Ligilactobacillus araffinosus]|uniref:Phosphate transport system permease protein PstA n=1 Tax=Ligilactobacillus araffinosus DSM 20653 TaxID=1423820 RepID=A0A0R1ZFD9_9LACO|nr:phosphate ABC transporter permease PstA [Ligilactobacillus araffinosus]KRM52917.1 phosphate abc transporter, permease protein [Ligilactobacillus araffinosus DSM 20653]